jgi:hypothetical protein
MEKENEQKICPLFVTAYIATGKSFTASRKTFLCGGDACAWWNEGQDGCSILVIGERLTIDTAQ